MSAPGIFHDAKNGYYFHGMLFAQPGDRIPTHRHASYRHRLRVTRGKLRLWDEHGGERVLEAGRIATIPAGIAHELVALEADTFACCVHRLFDEHGNYYPFDYQLAGRELGAATGRL